MDAFGKDKIIIETVGAGQNEIDIVRTADTVAVLVPPGSGDDIQTLKAGILEIADIFVVNKADRDGADRTVQELREMIHLGDGSDPPVAVAITARKSSTPTTTGTGSRTRTTRPTRAGRRRSSRPSPSTAPASTSSSTNSQPTGTTSSTPASTPTRYAPATPRRFALCCARDVHSMLEEELAAAGGIDGLAEAVRNGETDPYTIA